MMKSRHKSSDEIENKIGGKSYLEFTVHLLELECFNPIVFCHDNGLFDREYFAQAVIGFTNLLSFLYSCGITINTEVHEPNDVEIEIYKHIMKDNELSGMIRYYELQEIDFTEFSIEDAVIPENCEVADFALVKTYLLLKTGAALNRKSIEKIFEKRLTDSEALAVRKQLNNISGKEIIKRRDNSFEMR